VARGRRVRMVRRSMVVLMRSVQTLVRDRMSDQSCCFFGAPATMSRE
jgi:hypothetical protein